uniref:hypothetical protein n=1 Tax=Thaumasiovibrio occultus TaxID=1891184 RepID=UPI00131D7582|nr:hypothetical protein [Thaumasiovibrio occultus]
MHRLANVIVVDRADVAAFAPQAHQLTALKGKQHRSGLARGERFTVNESSENDLVALIMLHEMAHAIAGDQVSSMGAQLFRSPSEYRAYFQRIELLADVIALQFAKSRLPEARYLRLQQRLVQLRLACEQDNAHCTGEALEQWLNSDAAAQR